DSINRFGYSASAISILSSLYEEVGNIDKAVEILMKLEDIDTQKGQGYLQIGNLFYRKSNPQKAIEYFEKYLPFHPASEDVYLFTKLGELYEQIGNINKAVEYYSKLENINSFKGQGHFYSGLLYERKERWADALKEFEYVLEIKPKDSPLLLKIGKLYEKIGNNRKALEVYEKVIAIDPTKETELTIPMGRLYENIGEREMAIGLFKRGRML
ncbi:MAG: tetratricopeptide repeat protein, partial [Nitrospinota bacterium]